MSAGAVTLAAPLNPNASLDLRFLFGVQQQGKYNFCAVIETMAYNRSSSGMPGVMLASAVALSCAKAGTAPASARGDDKEAKK